MHKRFTNVPVPAREVVNRLRVCRIWTWCEASQHLTAYPDSDVSRRSVLLGLGDDGRPVALTVMDPDPGNWRPGDELQQRTVPVAGLAPERVAQLVDELAAVG